MPYTRSNTNQVLRKLGSISKGMKFQCKPLILVTIFLIHLSTISLAQFRRQDIPYFELILSLEPENNLLRNKMTMVIDTSLLVDGKLNLIISEAAKIDLIEGEGIIKKQIISTDGIFKQLILTFEKPTEPELSIVMEYELVILDSVKRNSISTDWIELNSFSYWVPSFKEFIPFKYSMQLGLDNSYQLITGDHSLSSEEANDHFLVMSRIPRTSIAFSATKNLHSAEGKYTIVYANKSTIKREELVSLADSSLAFLSKYIEKPNDFSHKRSIVLSPLDGSSYGVKNYLILNSIEHISPQDMSCLLVYEFARYWFSSADPNSKHAWLSESFAEYLSLIFLRETYGILAFEQAIERKEKEIINETKVMLAFEARPSYIALHHKGPIMLHLLEEYIGKEQFKKILNRMIDQRIDTNEKLYNLISIEFGNYALDELHRLRSTF